MAGDYSRLHRLVRLLMLMQSGDAGSAGELAAKFGVAERTIYRDLEVLTDLGVPCYLDEETGGYRVRRDFFLPPVQLTAAETLALLCLSQVVGEQEQIPFTAAAVQGVEKLKAQLPQKVLDELGDVDRHVEVQLPATGPAGEAISDVYLLVRQAISQRRAVRCRYESLNQETNDGPFIFRPYLLAFEQRSWYAIGRHDGRGEVRRLKLNRFTAIEPTDIPYLIPEDFSLGAYRGKAWRMIRGDRLYEIVIDFGSQVADTVSDTNWHPTQEVVDHPDGSITFRCEVEGLDEIVWWVLGYGPHAHVRQPKELAEQVTNLAEETAKRYG